MHVSGLSASHLSIPSANLVPLTARPLQGSFLASSLSTDIGSILFVFSELLVLAGRQDRLWRFRSVYPPFSRKENKMSGIFIDSAQAAPSTIFVDAAPCPIETRSIYILSGEKEKEKEREKEREKKEKGGTFAHTRCVYLRIIQCYT